ncbi:disease resistance protein RPP8-like [Telopea speciosissima]|uniref:disease resistance protein RPP8-like n=1 Tax=Telopea speciosissima TaxID=54955 RepID=UPI001CC48166|nr:disease resistance protein RPP8-like [Telopea speciosissima]
MARAVLSMIDEFTDTISQAKSQLDIESEVQLIVQPTHSELLAIRRFLEDQDGGSDNEDTARKKHYADLESAIHEAEDAIMNYVLRTARARRRKTLFKIYAPCKDSGSRKNFHKEISPILERIKGFKEKYKESSSHYSGGKTFKLSDWIRSSVEFDEPEDLEYLSNTVVGLEKDLRSLEEKLLAERNSHSIVSVLGIQGIGKTTLAWQVYKNSSVVYHFQCKAWVCASAMDNDLEDIWKDICKQIKEFHWNKRYLIVIDDVCDLQLWTELREKITLKESGGGSSIILTTRDAGVAYSADCSPHRMKVLNEADSWKLFKKKVFIAPWQLGNESDDKYTTDPNQSPIPLPAELEDLGKKMVKKCGGIPYLIVELANLLSSTNANTLEWSCVLNGTDTHLSQEQLPWFNLSSSVDEILPLHVKQFLHLFPTKTKIPERRLRLSWAAEGSFGLWQQSDSGNSGGMEEEAASRWMQDLKDLNLIQPAKVSFIGITKAYCIPHDLPLLQILKAGRGGTIGSSHDDGKGWIYRIADHCDNNIHSHRIHCSMNSSEDLEPYRTLRSFWCFNYPGGYKHGQEVGSFLRRCINNNHLLFLRVLDLEGVYKPSLSKEIGELINLQYLGLRWTYLDTLPSSLEKLHNLQTLDTKHTDIASYPMIQDMKRLQYLYLNERHSSGLVSQLSSLTDLKTLSGVIVDNLSPVKDGLDKLTKLKKLRLTCRGLTQPQKQEMAEWIGKLQNLQTVKLTSKDHEPKMTPSSSLLKNLRNEQLSRMYLRGRWEDKLEFCHNFGSNLTALTFSLTELTEDPMPTLEGLTNLKLVCLFSKSYTGNRMHCSSGKFKELRVLRIWRLENLEVLTVEPGAMAQLEELEIRSCKKLKMLPNVPEGALPELRLTDMPKDFISNVVKGGDCQKVAHLSSVIIEDWLPSFNTSVKLYTGRNSVFDQGQLLEKLFQRDRFQVINLIQLTLSETKLEQDPMPVLEKLPELMVLTLSSKSFKGKRMGCSQGGFKKLQRLTIQELEELEELIVVDGAMPKLDELEIISCKNLKVLREVLKRLKFSKMPKEFTEKFKADKRVTIEDL